MNYETSLLTYQIDYFLYIIIETLKNQSFYVIITRLFIGGTYLITLSHPNQIRIGFNKRADTYSGLLAYIIYMNSGTKYGKEKSFNSWIDGSIPIQDITNPFLRGFVLNKTIKRDYYSSATNALRIYHPHGFEFEITPENFVTISSNSNISSGEIMEPCTLAWDGSQIVLVPESFVKHKIVSLKPIDVIGKIQKKFNEDNAARKKRVYIDINKLKPETIYLHENGREYYLNGVKKQGISQLSRFHAVELTEKFSFLKNSNKYTLASDTSYNLIPYALDHNQDNIIDASFMSKFISKVNNPLTSYFNGRFEGQNQYLLPFNSKANFEVYNGSQNQINIFKEAIEFLNTKPISRDRNNDFLALLPISIKINNIDFLIGFSKGDGFLNGFDYFDNLPQVKQIINANKMISETFVEKDKRLVLSLIPIQKEWCYEIIPQEALEDLNKYHEQQKNLFNNIPDEQSLVSSLFATFSSFKQMMQSPPFTKLPNEEFINRCVNLLNELGNLTAQDNCVNLNTKIIRIEV